MEKQAKKVTTLPEEKRKACKPKGTKIETVLALQAANPDLNQKQLAKMVNVSPAALSGMLKRYGLDRKRTESFKTDRADIFAGLQEVVASTFTEEDIKKASIRDRTILLGTLYDKERLERGQSTSNQSVFFHIVAEACGTDGDQKE